eukprot:scaffold2871_cov106-Isochrysis_galbana.AAC.2
MQSGGKRRSRAGAEGCNELSQPRRERWPPPWERAPVCRRAVSRLGRRCVGRTAACSRRNCRRPAPVLGRRSAKARGWSTPSAAPPACFAPAA